MFPAGSHRLREVLKKPRDVQPAGLETESTLWHCLPRWEGGEHLPGAVRGQLTAGIYSRGRRKETPVAGGAMGP